MGVSRREFAKLVGVGESAVRKAISSGRLSILDDGTIDPENGKSQWSRGTDPARTKVRPSGAQGAQAASAIVRTEQDAIDAVTLIRRVLSEEGAESAGTIDFGMARTAETILKARERELKMAERRKVLVPLAKVKEHVAKAFIGYRQAVQRLPSRHAAAIAAEVGCDPGALDAALARAVAAELEALSAPVVRG